MSDSPEPVEVIRSRRFKHLPKKYLGYFLVKDTKYKINNWLVRHNFKQADSSYLAHARRELELAGYDLNQKEEDPNKWVCESLFELLNVFSSQGHSGFSASYCISMFEKLARFEPITPLTGEDDEWECVSEFQGKECYQNKRISSVFKDGKDAKAYWIDGKAFRTPDGATYTNSDSKVFIEFPWTKPETEIIDVEE